MVKEGAEEGAWWPCVDASGLVEHWWLPSRYALRSLVGRGTYGVCAKVWCAETDTVYVVKRVQLLVPRREMKMTGRLASWAVIALRRTLREVAVLRRLQELDHPHIVRLHGAWTDCAPNKSRRLVAGGAGKARRPIPALYLLFEALHPHPQLVTLGESVGASAEEAAVAVTNPNPNNPNLEPKPNPSPDPEPKPKPKPRPSAGPSPSQAAVASEEAAMGAMGSMATSQRRGAPPSSPALSLAEVARIMHQLLQAG